MGKTVLILALVTMGLQCLAQIPQKYRNDLSPSLSGIILDNQDSKTLPYVHIFNKTTGKGAISDLSGKFTIPFNDTDSIVMSAVGFEDYIFTIADSESSASHYFITIKLNQSTLELSPVTIFAFKDEASFKKDILNLKLADAENKIIIPGSYMGIPQPAKTKVYFNGGLACNGCLSSILNLFNKEAKESKRHKRILEEAPRKFEIYKKYDPEMVQELTGLQEEDLLEFMLFCELSDDFILNASEYDILLSVNACYDEFPPNSNEQ